jgi:carboxypeptidase C (cathepsin A)
MIGAIGLMKKLFLRPLVLAALIPLLLPPVAAADKPAATAEERPSKPVATLPGDSKTSHVLHLPDHDLPYAATAGTLPLMSEKGEKQADIFYLSYVADNPKTTERPVTFVFNGGPGAASAYLNLGALGPEILNFDAQGTLAGTPPVLSQNPDSWLDFTDLVFVDPVGTGYSRAAPGIDAAKLFWGIRQDAEAMAAFIRLYLTRTDRLASPKYLVGESYGGFRAARLAHELLSDPGIAVTGLVLVSPALDLGLIHGGEMNPLPAALLLPSYAAVAAETHGPITPEAMGEAERFALTDYLSTLARPLSGAAADRFYASVAHFIGLPEDVVRRWRGRVPVDVYVKEIHRAEGRVMSDYDGTIGMIDPFPARETAHGNDPILQGTIAPFTSAIVTDIRQSLGFKTDFSYELLNSEVSAHWDWRSGGGETQASAADDLKEAVALDPKLRILMAQGLTDLVTPYLAGRYVVDHLPTVAATSPIRLKLYPGGHMMYLRPASRARLKEDAKDLYLGRPG